MNKTPYFMQPTTQTIVRHTVIFCTTQRKDAQDREPTRRQKPSHLVGTPNGWTLSSVGPAKKFCFDNGKGRGKKIPCYLNWNTHPVLPASFVIWIHNPSIVQENLRHELKQIWGGSAPLSLEEGNANYLRKTLPREDRNFHLRNSWF